MELLQGWELTPHADQYTFPIPGSTQPTQKVTYVDIVNVQDTRVELEAQRLSLLDRVGQLAVGLQQEANVPI